MRKGKRIDLYEIDIRCPLVSNYAVKSLLKAFFFFYSNVSQIQLGECIELRFIARADIQNPTGRYILAVVHYKSIETT